MYDSNPYPPPPPSPPSPPPSPPPPPSSAAELDATRMLGPVFGGIVFYVAGKLLYRKCSSRSK
jgi:hypothetical protein